MPELPDIALYIEHLERRFSGERLTKVRVANPFLMRTAVPPLSEVFGRRLSRISRLGKRLVFELEGDLCLVLHLMVAGRLRLGDLGATLPKKLGLAGFDFESGTVVLTEAGTKRRASLHLVGRKDLGPFDRGGLDVRSATLAEFTQALTRRRHTLKRALTDPTLFDGIGNAFSDEILHRAKLSPFVHSTSLTEQEHERLLEAAQHTLREWIERLRRETGDAFPTKVTAFREGMAAHGRFGKPCLVCQTPIARIVYADNETNYCPGCQTNGRLLADRSMSRLLGADWPRSWEELEELRPAAMGKANPGRSTKAPAPKQPASATAGAKPATRATTKPAVKTPTNKAGRGFPP